MGDQGVTVDDVERFLQDITDALSLSTFNDAKVKRMAKVWHWQLREFPVGKCKSGVRRLLQRYEGTTMPKVKQLVEAIQSSGHVPGPRAGAWQLWYDQGFTIQGQELEPCPVCNGMPSWSPRLYANCAPDEHHRAGVPCAGNAAVNADRGARDDVPTQSLRALVAGLAQAKALPSPRPFERGDAFEEATP